jgi:hypothetical protein
VTRQLSGVHSRIGLRGTGQTLPLAIPVPLATGGPAEGYPFDRSVCAWLPGENTDSATIEDPDRAAVHPTP